MKEKGMQSVFKEQNTIMGVFELKLIKVKQEGEKFKPLPFDAVAEHQIDSLLACDGDAGLYHKISDSFVGDKSGERRFPSAKPFDCFFLRSIPAFVVIAYYIPRKLKEFHYIPIRVFVEERNTCGRKSLTYMRSKELAYYLLINGSYETA